jgi:alpha-1,6-mannosyltransferase
VALPSRSETTRPAGTRALLAASLASGLVGSLLLALFGTVVGALPIPRHGDWFIQLPTSQPLSITAFYVGLGLLAAGWLGLGWLARRGGLRLAACWGALAAWGLPLVLGPPLFSRDLYSYVAQGLLAARRLNPYTTPPSVLHALPVYSGIASVWQHTPAPYGPLALLATLGSVKLSGSSLASQLITMRLAEVVGVVLMGILIPKIARRLGADPALGFWLGVLSPLSLISLLASGHNEGLMLGLLLAAVLAFLDERPLAGSALGAAAAAVKLPAALAIAFPVMSRLRSSKTGRGRLVALVLLTSAAVWALLTVLTGFGLGWLSSKAFTIPAQLRTLATPSVALGVFIASIFHVLGISVATQHIVTVTRSLVSVVTVGALAWLLWSAHRYDWVRLLGLSLLLVAVGSPTLWPWYFTWGICVLAATAAQRSIALAILASLPVLMVGAQGTPALTGHSYLVTVPLLIAGTTWLATKGRWRSLLGAARA